jgi:competence protein ComEA
MSRTFLPLVALAAVLASQSQAQTTRTRTIEPTADKPTVQVNLNTATVADLQQLPGVGAKVAARIVDYRQKQGPFKRIEELMNIQGIGEKSFLKLRPQITVGGKTEATPPPQK